MFETKKQSQNKIGLDISDSALKLIQLNPGKRGKQVIQAYANFGLPKEMIEEGTIKDRLGLVSMIRKAMNHPLEGRVTTSYVVASIPENKTFVRVIHLPKMTTEEANQAIPFEAEAYVPLPIGQVYLDWMMLPADEKSQAENKMTVLLAAAPRSFIDSYVKVIRDAGLVPVGLEVESQATARSLIGSKEEGKTVLIFDSNAVRSSIVILENNVQKFSSSLPVAGNIYTERIAQSLGLKFDEAEELKRKVGLDPDFEKGAVAKALRPVLDSLIDEIRNSIRFYEEHSPEDKVVSKVILAGGANRLAHLPSYLQEGIQSNASGSGHKLRSLPNITVELGNPWVNVLRKGQAPPLSREESLAFATAIGLTLWS